MKFQHFLLKSSDLTDDELWYHGISGKLQLPQFCRSKYWTADTQGKKEL